MKTSDLAAITESIFKADEQKIKTSGAKLINDPVKGITKVDAPDVSKYKVNSDFTQKILEQSFGIKTESKPEIKEEKKEKLPDISEVDPQVFVVRLVELIKEAKQLIKEMTDCGAIGVNMAGANKPVKKKKRDRKKKLLLKFKHKFGR